MLKLWTLSFLCLLTGLPHTYAITYPAADFSGPRKTFNYFLKTMKGYKLGDEDALNKAVQTLNLSNLDSKTRQISGRQAAIKLINTLDRLEYIDISDIPKDVDGDKWVYRKQEILVEDEYQTVEISLGKTKSEKWLFTPKTVSTIALFERAVKGRKVAKGVTEYDSWKESIKKSMPEWTAQRSFILLNGQWLGLFALIFLAFLTERIAKFILGNIIIRFLQKRGLKINQKFNKKLMFPLGIIIFTVFWSMGVRVLELEDDTLSWFLRAGQVLFTLGCIMAFYQLVDYLCLYLEKKANESENKFDDILIPLIRKSAKTFVVAVGIIAVGDSLTLDMKGLLAGMGIAGLGVSLAAKDTISNLFGSLTVLLDRPFRIGDWVKINDSIEGMVEEVGLRSCRIRTFHNSLITIPNGLLTNASIDNMGLRSYRRFSTVISLQYDTPPKKIEAFCEAIRHLLANSDGIRKDYFHVYFNNMGSHSLDILLYVFFKVPDWSMELQERHRLLMEILKLGHECGVEFAFPTQTLHVIQGDNPNYDELPKEDKIEAYAKDLAHGIKKKNFTPEKSRSSTLEMGL